MWNGVTGWWRDRITQAVSPGDNYVPLPGHLAYRSRLEFNQIPLNPTSLNDLDGGRPSWEGETTAAAGVPSTPRVWAPVSLDLVVIWPATAPPTGGTLTIDGIANTPVLVNPTDYLDLGQEELNQLLGYALHVAAFKYGGDIFAATMPLYKDFLRAAAERNDEFGESNLYRKVINFDWTQNQTPMKVPPTPDAALQPLIQEQMLPRYIRPQAP